MNTISWTIYLATIADGFKGMFAFSAFVTGFVVFIAGGITISGWMDGETIPRTWKRWLIFLTVCFPIFATLAIGIPGKQTIYLIAASELGQQAASTPEAQALLSEARQALQRLLKQVGE